MALPHPALPAPAPTARPAGLLLFTEAAAAGFPSPAEGYTEGRVDLAAHLVRRPAATFLLRVAGDSMLGAGIHDGDLLVVDRSLEPVPGRVVVAAVDGALTVKRLRREGGAYALVAENPACPPVPLHADVDVVVWGVVTFVVHALAPHRAPRSPSSAPRGA